MLEIFQYDFMVRAFGVGIIIGIIAPLVGIFIVVRRYSLIADTLAHVSLLGVAVSSLLYVHPIFGALATTIVASIGIEKLRRAGKVFSESILSIFLAGSLALALTFFSLSGNRNTNMQSFLFGSITTVTLNDFWMITGLAFLVVFTITVLYRKIFLISFDEEIAEVNGLNTGLINLIIIVLTAVSVSIAMQIVGVLLIGALIVIPVLTAMQLRSNFFWTLVYSIMFSLLSVISGLYFSFYLNFPAGATIVLINILQFLIILVWGKK